MHVSVTNLHQIYEARAFTHGQMQLFKPVRGNPATSFFVPHGIPDQDYAASLAVKAGSPMSVFVAPLQKETEFELRFFTPQGHLFPLCGHASMVAAVQLQQLYRTDKFRFRLNDMGQRPVWLHATVNNGFVQLQMPAYPPAAAEHKVVSSLVTAVGLTMADVVGVHTCERLNDFIIHVHKTQALRHAMPDMRALSILLQQAGIRGLFLTSPSAEPMLDYEVRIFAPHLGIDEDISCGSANCSVLPLWSKILNRNDAEPFKVLCPYNSSDAYYGGIEYVRYIEQKTVIEVGGYVSADPE